MSWFGVAAAAAAASSTQECRRTLFVDLEQAVNLRQSGKVWDPPNILAAWTSTSVKSGLVGAFWAVHLIPTL